MKTTANFRYNQLLSFLLLVLVSLSWPGQAKASANQNFVTDTTSYVQFKGNVIDLDSRKSLGFATLILEGSNLSTVANSEGEFSFKVPAGKARGNVIVSYLGHKDRIIPLSTLKPERNHIELELQTVTLSTISVHPKDPDIDRNSGGLSRNFRKLFQVFPKFPSPFYYFKNKLNFFLGC